MIRRRDRSHPSRPRLRAVAGGVALVVAAVTGSCGSDSSTPSAGDDAQLDRGAEVYSVSCASCHGEDLRGTDRGPSHLSIVYEPGHHDDASFRAAIANGAPQHHWPFGDMEPVPGLSDDDIESVIAYIRSEQVRQGFEQ